MQKFLKYSFLPFLLCCFISADAQEFIAKTSHRNLKTGDRFQVEFSANAKMGNFTPPNFSDFQVLSGPNQSTSMSWVNGKTTNSISYSYVLRAVKEGKFTIGPASASIGSKKLQTNSIEIVVGKGKAVQNSSNNSDVNKQASSNDLFIKASVSKTKAYQGEQIIATYKLYTRVNISGNELVKNADLNGFWSQEIDFGQSQWSEEIIQGYRWSVATIRKIVLFPQRSGDLLIDPLEMKFVVQKRVQGGGRSMFDQFFGRVENVEYTVKSKPIKIKVSPHPSPKPSGFAGAVGKLNMHLDVSKNEVKANEAVNVKIKVSGNGNINLIDNLAINFPADFETYDPKINNNIKTTVKGVSGTKEFDYLVIPRHAGNFKIDPVVFSYFDPGAKKYKTITSEPIVINVLKSDGTAADNITYTPSSKEEIKILGEDIRYIHTGNIKFVTPDNTFFGSWKFYALLLLAPLLFILAYIFRNKIRAITSDTVGMKRKKAGKMAKKFLSSAKKSLDAKDKNAFYEDVSKALFGYIGNKLNISSSELNKDNIKTQLNAFHISEEIAKELMETVELCDMARFAPVNISEAEVYAKAEKIINQMEKEILKS